MEIHDFIKRVHAQPVITVERTIRVPGPTLLALLAEDRPPTVAELDAHPDQHSERRTYHDAHVLGPGLTESVIDDWQSRHVGHRLPNDLRDLLTQVNGIHLWADLESSRGYAGIHPLEEWDDAADSVVAELFEERPVGQLVLSYHENGDYSLILDTNGPQYRWHDHGDFDDFEVAGSTVEQLLDFWWKEIAWLDPTKEG